MAAVKNITALQLMRYHNEIQAWENNKSVLMEFHRSKIREFYKDNQARLDSLNSQFIRLQQKYFEFDENGNVQMAKAPSIIVPGGEKKAQERPVMKNGLTIEQFQQEVSALHEQVIPFTVS